jgi:hypothetical protein
MIALRNPGRTFWISGSIAVVIAAAIMAFTVTGGLPFWTGVGLSLIVCAIAANHLTAWAALAGLALPLSPIFVFDVGGSTVAFSEVFALLGIVFWLVVARRRAPLSEQVSVLRHLWIPAATMVAFSVPYLLVALVDTAIFYPSITSFAAIVQRAEIVIVWIVFGAIIGFTKNAQGLIIAFVSASAVIGVLWMGGIGQGAVYGMQKNPSGGFIAASILIMLLSNMPNIWRLPLLAVLGAGLVATGSRGSILGLAVALVFVAVFRSQWKRTLIPLGLVLVAGVAGFFALPNDMRARMLSQGESASYNTNIRGTFIADALQHFFAQPWYGIGVGNYKQTDSALSNVATQDPHNVYALTLAEGGYPLLAAFAILTLGTAIWLLFQRPRNTKMVLAVSVQIGLLVHTAVDVYWVRGTPSIGWLLVGMAAAVGGHAASKHTQAEDEPEGESVESSARSRTLETYTPRSGVRLAHGRRRRH